MLNARRNQNELYYHSEHVFGVSKTPRTITWGYTAPDMQTRRQHDHQSNTLIRRPRSTHHPKRTMFRIQPQASPQERIKSTQDHGLALQSWRAIASEAQVAAHLSQHTNDQRAEAAQSMRHWPADPPPRAKHASKMPLPVPVERRASQLIQLEICVPLQPRTEQTFKPRVI